MRLDMAVLQYDKHPGKYQGINFHARAHGHFLALDGIWRDASGDIFGLLSDCPAMGSNEFEDRKLAKLHQGLDKDLEWSINRLKWTGQADSLADAASVSTLTDPWFKFRMGEIKRSLFLHPKTAGPIKKNARLECSAAFSAMHVALRALESRSGQAELAALSRTALARPQSI